MIDKMLKRNVSIIIPTYNWAQFLPQCLESVFKQTYRDFEVIIVDDGSTDDTKDVVEGYIQQYGETIKYIYQDHVNTACARNRGLKMAQGQHIAFLDSDDMWMPSKLEKQVRYLDEYDVDLVHTGREVAYLTNDLSSSLLPMPHVLAHNAQEYLGGKTFISMTGLVKKVPLLDVGGFNEEYKTTEDFELWVRFAKEYKIGVIEEPLVVIRKHDRNQSTMDLELKYADRVRIYESMVADPHPWIDKIFWQQRLGMTYYGLAKEKLKRGKHREHAALMAKSGQWQWSNVGDVLQRGGMSLK